MSGTRGYIVARYRTKPTGEATVQAQYGCLIYTVQIQVNLKKFTCVPTGGGMLLVWNFSSHITLLFGSHGIGYHDPM